MLAIPPMPADRPHAAASVPLRFEDVTQDGRLALESLPTALSPSVWRRLFAFEAAQALRSRGIVPILTRLRLLGSPGPFSAQTPVQAEASVHLVQTEDGRYMLEMWADLYAPLGRTYGDGQHQEGVEGDRALAGRVLAEHVLTRPFAPPGQRRVTDLSFPGAPPVTRTRPALPPFDSIACVPEGAAPLEPRRTADPLAVVFGIVHTDSNMHVNSLVYLRLFEEAALRRLAALGRGSILLARAVDIVYRKPCFAGETMRVAQQAYESPEGALGVAAVLVTEAEAGTDAGLAHARPRTYVRMELER